MEKEAFFDRNIKRMRNVALGVTVEKSPFVKQMAEMSRKGWEKGWHFSPHIPRSPIGSLSYRLKKEEVSKSLQFFASQIDAWNPLEIRSQTLQNEFFVVTGRDSSFETLAYDLSCEMGIIEINSTGDFWRNVWGFNRTNEPTQDLHLHLLAHAVCKDASSGKQRIVYHANPAVLQTLPPEFGTIVGSSRLKFPLLEKVAFCWEHFPNPNRRAQKIAELLRSHPIVFLAEFGVLCTGQNLADVFSDVAELEKIVASLRTK